MAIKRYKVGRSYTERTYLVADLDDYEAVQTVMEILAAADRTLARFFDYLQRYPRAHPSRDFIR